MGHPLLKKAIQVVLQHWKSINWSRRALYVFTMLVLYVVLSTGSEESTTYSPNLLEAIETKSPIIPWQGQNPEFCEEPGNTIADANHPHAHLCKCTDPTIPLPQDRPEWLHHHQTIVQDVQYWGAKKPFDVVFLGDSLIEHWNGTHRWGATRSPDVRALFESLFTKRGGAKFEALALGNSASTTVNLLWQLQNGILSPTNHLNPKLWVVLVGTNDLSGTRCSSNVTTHAIVRVAETIAEARPDSRILLHGLLPRGEGGRLAMTLGNEWERIQKVNHNLEIIARNRTHWYYWDTGNLFVNAQHTSLDSRLIADGIHPRKSGLSLWGPRMADAIQKILVEEAT